MHRSDFDFDVISGPATPPPKPVLAAERPAPKPASLDPAAPADEIRKP